MEESRAGCLPHVRVTQHTEPAVQMQQHVSSVSAPGRPRTHCFLGAVRGTLCFACTKFPEGKQVFSIDRVVHTDHLGTVNPPVAVGNTESQFPGASHRPALQTGLSKDAVSGVLCSFLHIEGVTYVHSQV